MADSCGRMPFLLTLSDACGGNIVSQRVRILSEASDFHEDDDQRLSMACGRDDGGDGGCLLLLAAAVALWRARGPSRHGRGERPGFGPPTPEEPPPLNVGFVQQMIGDLWEDGREVLVEMMAEMVAEARNTAMEEGRHTPGMEMLYRVFEPYRCLHRPVVALPPIWQAWVEEKIRLAMSTVRVTGDLQGPNREEGEAQEREAETLINGGVPAEGEVLDAEAPQTPEEDVCDPEDDDLTSMMQNLGLPVPRGLRPQAWEGQCELLHAFPPAVQGRVMFRLRQWIGAMVSQQVRNGGHPQRPLAVHGPARVHDGGGRPGRRGGGADPGQPSGRTGQGGVAGRQRSGAREDDPETGGGLCGQGGQTG